MSIQTWSAVAMLGAGSLMAFISLFLPPVGDISTGALWYCGQCFLYAGGIMGIAGYTKNKVDEIKEELKANS